MICKTKKEEKIHNAWMLDNDMFTWKFDNLFDWNYFSRVWERERHLNFLHFSRLLWIMFLTDCKGIEVNYQNKHNAFLQSIREPDTDKWYDFQLQKLQGYHSTSSWNLEDG